MRRCLCLLLLAALLLTGCSSALSDNEVAFYYRQDSAAFQSDDPNGVLATEARGFTNPTDDLAYLLAIYLQGPQDPQLRSPFPAGTKLLGAREDGDTLYITLSASFTRLENLDLTLACACMVKTCADLTDASYICIQAEDPERERSVSMTIHRDQLLLQDSTALSEEPPKETN